MPNLILFIIGTFAAAINLSAAVSFGYTEPNRVAEMAFPENGVVSEILVNEGDRVEAGQILARLNIGILQAERAIAAEQVNFQALKFEQYERLRESGNASLEEFERAKSDYAIAQLQVERIDAQIEDRSLRAPFDAVVETIHLELAESAAAQAKAISIVELDRLKLNLNLPIAEATDLEQGQSLQLKMDYHGELMGEVRFISPTFDAASQTVRVELLIDNADRQYRSGLMTQIAEGAGLQP